MRIHALYHVSFEKPGCILDWIKVKNHRFRESNLFQDENLPSVEDFDMLIIMGGPMGVSDNEKYLWLSLEKGLIRQAIDADKAVLGICLGAQLIAAAMGCKVYPAAYKEIGWFPVIFNKMAKNKGLQVPDEMIVFHWHGDTFDLPEGSLQIASSATTPNQAFLYGDKVFGIQFHMEMKHENIEMMIENAGHELMQDAYIQSSDEIIAGAVHLPFNNQLIFSWLDYLECQIQK
jgi:GMP synthase-like glutamine amidotransferase